MSGVLLTEAQLKEKALREAPMTLAQIARYQAAVLDNPNGAYAANVYLKLGRQQGDLLAKAIKTHNARQNNSRFKIEVGKNLLDEALDFSPLGTLIYEAGNLFHKGYKLGEANFGGETYDLVSNKPITVEDLRDIILDTPEVRLIAEQTAKRMGIVISAGQEYDFLISQLDDAIEQVDNGLSDTQGIKEIFGQSDHPIAESLPIGFTKKYFDMARMSQLPTEKLPKDGDAGLKNAVESKVEKHISKIHQMHEAGASQADIKGELSKFRGELLADAQLQQDEMKLFLKNQLEFYFSKPKEISVNSLELAIKNNWQVGGRKLYGPMAKQLDRTRVGFEALEQALILFGESGTASHAISYLNATMQVIDGVGTIAEIFAKEYTNEQIFISLAGGLGNVFAAANVVLSLSQVGQSDPMQAMLKQALEQLQHLRIGQQKLSIRIGDLEVDLARIRAELGHNISLLQEGLKAVKENDNRNTERVLSAIDKSFFRIARNQDEILVAIQDLNLENRSDELVTKSRLLVSAITHEDRVEVDQRLADLTEALTDFEVILPRLQNADTQIQNTELSNQESLFIRQKNIASTLASICEGKADLKAACRNVIETPSEDRIGTAIQAVLYALDALARLPVGFALPQNLEVILKTLEEILERSIDDVESARVLLPHLHVEYAQTLAQLRDTIIAVANLSVRSVLGDEVRFEIKPDFDKVGESSYQDILGSINDQIRYPLQATYITDLDEKDQTAFFSGFRAIDAPTGLSEISSSVLAMMITDIKSFLWYTSRNVSPFHLGFFDFDNHINRFHQGILPRYPEDADLIVPILEKVEASDFSFLDFSQDKHPPLTILSYLQNAQLSDRRLAIQFSEMSSTQAGMALEESGVVERFSAEKSFSDSLRVEYPRPAPKGKGLHSKSLYRHTGLFNWELSLENGYSLISTLPNLTGPISVSLHSEWDTLKENPQLLGLIGGDIKKSKYTYGLYQCDDDPWDDCKDPWNTKIVNHQATNDQWLENSKVFGLPTLQGKSPIGAEFRYQKADGKYVPMIKFGFATSILGIDMDATKDSSGKLDGKKISGFKVESEDKLFSSIHDANIHLNNMHQFATKLFVDVSSTAQDSILENWSRTFNNQQLGDWHFVPNNLVRPIIIEMRNAKDLSRKLARERMALGTLMELAYGESGIVGNKELLSKYQALVGGDLSYNSFKYLKLTPEVGAIHPDVVTEMFKLETAYLSANNEYMPSVEKIPHPRKAQILVKELFANLRAHIQKHGELKSLDQDELLRSIQ